MRKAIYGGTFDPITNGHFDIIQRALKIFDEVYVVIFNNPAKKSLFSVEERLALMKEALKDLDHVKVDVSDDLAVEYARKVGACAMVRGLRATQDYHYESMMAYCNQYLDHEIEMVFLMTQLSYTFISSSAVKEMASHHSDVSPLVPRCVDKALIKKYAKS
jgi:pantetheine-phosphate adenylyltransferase